MISCDVEEFIPIPTGTEKKYSNIREKAIAACNAAKLLEDEGYSGEETTAEENRNAAKVLLESLAKGEEPKPAAVNNALNTPGSAYFVRSILQEYDMEIVHEAKSLRHYVTNKLIVESDNNDARIRMKALELLGKISDVGLFTERTEVTVHQKSTSELEDVLKSKLKKLLGHQDTGEVIDAVILQPVEVQAKTIDVHEMLKGI